MVQLLKLHRGVASKLEMWKAIGPFAALPRVCLCKDFFMSGWEKLKFVAKLGRAAARDSGMGAHSWDFKK